MSNETTGKRRVIRGVPHTPARIERVSEVVTVPPVEGVLSKAITTVSNEINKLYVQSHKYSLTDKEARVLQGHIKILIELSREQRERDKSDDLSKMSDEEIYEVAKQIISKRES